MKNIKIIFSSFLLSASLAFLCANALAKTQGSNVSVNLAHNKSSHKYKIGRLDVGEEFDNSKIGYGIAYKYSFNFNNLFVAPELFFDKIDTKSNNGFDEFMLIKDRYGLKVNLGYDFSDQFAGYISGGLADINYKVDWQNVNAKKSGN